MKKMCKHGSCKEKAVFGSDFCWDHIQDKGLYKSFVIEQVKNGASLKGENLTKVDLAGADLSRQDLSNATLTRADLSNASLFDTRLKEAELLGTDLSGSDLTSADLEKADITKAVLRGARLWHANLKGANLIEADLTNADFWNAALYNARFWHTRLTGALSLGRQNFANMVHKYLTIYSIDERGIHSAEEAYRALKKHFLADGRYDDASWASFREKSMQRLMLKKKGNLAYFPSLIMNALCGYGEKPNRVILSSAIIIFIYAVIYKMFNAIYYPDYGSYIPNILDYVYFSIITFTTVGYGDFVPKAITSFRLIAASQAFIGAFMIGLFVFTLARKYSAR